MAYEKQGFYSGQPLQASQLDAMEDGIIEAQALAANAQANMNFEDGAAAGSVQQKGYSTEVGNILGAIASGEGAVAFGGQRHDKIGEDIAEEPQTEAKGIQSFAVGGGTLADGTWSVAIGKDTKAYQRASFAAGGGSKAGLTYEEWLEINSFEDTEENKIKYETTYGYGVALGEKAIATGRAAMAINNNTQATGDWSFAAGQLTTADALDSAVFGYNTKAYGEKSFAAGDGSETHGDRAFAIGWSTAANGEASFSQGVHTIANNRGTAALGTFNKTIDDSTNPVLFYLGNGGAEENRSNAVVIYKNGQSVFSGNMSVEGNLQVVGSVTIDKAPINPTDAVRKQDVVANLKDGGANFSVAGGYNSIANTTNSFAFGDNAVAGDETVNMSNCIALGNNVKATGYGSAAIGLGAQATGTGQVAVGRFNNPISGAYFIVGNGTADDARSNAFVVYSDGDIGIKYENNIYSLHKMLAAYFTEANLK